MSPRSSSLRGSTGERGFSSHVVSAGAQETAGPASGRSPDCRRILMVGTHPDTMGGISTVVRGYIEGGLFERFDCVYVATHRDGSALRKLLVALGAYLRIFFFLANRANAALLHIHLSSRASFWRKAIVCRMARLFQRPYILHVHGSEFMKFYDEECSPAQRQTVQRIFARSARVLALSEQWRENLLRICPGCEIEVLPNAVPVPVATSHADPGRRTVLFVGRLGRRKGTYDLLDAFTRLAPLCPDVRLVCAGDGDIEAVRGLAAQRGLAARVECPGWLDTQRTRDLLSKAAVFALPSYAEGLPMALLEAMSWGLPVVSTPVGGIPQLVEDGRNGLLVAPGNVDELTAALESLLAPRDSASSESDGSTILAAPVPARNSAVDRPVSQPGASLAERLGAAARATIVESFALPATLQRLETLYCRFGIQPRDARRHSSQAPA